MQPTWIRKVMELEMFVETDGLLTFRNGYGVVCVSTQRSWNMKDLLYTLDQYLALQELDREEKKESRHCPCLENKINGALIACINDHGPIDKLLVTSATKHILGAIKNA